MKRDPIDQAALELLRPLLADLEAGRVFITRLGAADARSGRLSLRWKEAEAPVDEPASDLGQALRHAAGLPCPECGATLVALEGPPFCTACAWQASASPAPG